MTGSDSHSGRWAVWAALGLGVAGVGLRLVLLLAGVPPTNSDEATNGLAAMHIAQGREFPVFFYGQHYMGTMVCYLAAPLFGLFEPSTLLLRIPTLLLYAAFLALMFQLSRRLFSPAVAVLTVAFLALGSDRLVKNELISGGGYAEIPAVLAALFLIGLGLAQRRYRREAWAFAAWGVLFGLVVWTHWLAMPYLLGALVLVARRLLERGAVWALAGAIVGASPLIWDNIISPAEHSSIATFHKLISAGGDPPLLDRLHGGVMVGLPLASGLCPAGYCTVAQLWWAPIYLLLMGTAGVWAWRRKDIATLALIGSAGLTIALYAISSGAAESPLESARYLHYLLVSTPVWIWVLWRLAAAPHGRGGLASVPPAPRPDARSVSPPLAAAWPAPHGRVWRMAAVGTLVLVGTLGLGATVSLVQKVPQYAAWRQQTDRVAQELRRLGVQRVYGGYWTCNLLTFTAREDVVCGVVNDDLSPGFNRYPPYWFEKERPAYLVLVESEIVDPESRLDAAVRDSGHDFTIVRLDGYHLYLPRSSREDG